MNRREFLVGSAAGVAGAAGLGVIGQAQAPAGAGPGRGSEIGRAHV